GEVNKGISGFGADARFGPPGSPFADRFFAATIYNNTIYQLKADRSCTPFVTFNGKPWAEPVGLAFSADGQRMLVSVSRGSTFGSAKAEGAILSVAANGTVDAKPVAEGFARPMGIARAPVILGEQKSRGAEGKWAWALLRLRGYTPAGAAVYWCD